MRARPPRVERQLHSVLALLRECVDEVVDRLSLELAADADVAVLKAAREAGASRAGIVALRLPGNVEGVFLDRLRRAMPGRAGRIEARIREMRGGRLYDPRFGSRMRGQGKYWAGIESVFEVWRRKLGYDVGPSEPAPATFRRPGVKGQTYLPFAAEN